MGEEILINIEEENEDKSENEEEEKIIEEIQL
jgi:hypothetical protein